MTITGVRIAPRRRIRDERGGVFHMLRRDDPESSHFGEIYFSQINPGAVKAWYRHSRMALNYLVVVGTIRLVLHDDRETSPTCGARAELTLDQEESRLVVVPPLVWYGFQGLGEGPSIVANCTTEPHDPTEMSRRPQDDPFFDFDWSRRHR